MNEKFFYFKCILIREVTEWLKVHAWKACVLARVPRVRIPSSLQFLVLTNYFNHKRNKYEKIVYAIADVYIDCIQY